MKLTCVACVMASTVAVAAVPFKNGTRFALRDVLGELLCGAAGTLNVSVTSKIYTPARIEV